MRRIILVGLILTLTVGCSSKTERPPAPGRVGFRTNNGTVETGPLLVADTQSERENGLMGVAHLARDQGMVFVFDAPTLGAFWMKDTLVPLSIAFWDERGAIVDILDMQPCESDPCPTYTSRDPYVEALEMNLGWFQDHGVEIGDHAELSYSSV